MKFSRIATAAAVVMLTAATVSSVTLSAALPAGGTPDRQGLDRPLRELAGRHFYVGTAVDNAAFAADATYRERVGTEFNSVTAENVMKWEVLEPERGRLDFTAADQLVASAKRNHQGVRGHTLVWHNQLPAWLTTGVESGEIDATELRGILRKHVTDVVRHFRGQI
jgi:endo-1,4-beta-xylanase